MSGKDLKFSFNFETKNKILAEIHNLDKKKACQESDIPVKIIKDDIDIFSEFLLHNFSNSIFDATFPSALKKADVTPIFKKKDRKNVENYRPVSILPNFSKIYERCLYDQMYKYFNHILSKWQCGFRKGFSTQHCLLVMTEKWRKCLDKEGVSRAILTDLSKAFDCILHNLLIAKLAAYGFDYLSLRIMESFLSNRQQKQKLIMLLAVILKLDMEFHRGRFWIPYFLISISATYFLTKSNAISQVMRTITHHIILVLI